ncbi:MAG: GTPase Era [Candidatus Sericytochromatia bacterium]|nr:GTPase Era [Candidatus Sericytochromatia bacterium]
MSNHSGFVAIVGRPNVGKSTLLNHVLGDKIAIVSSKPQTTRRRMKGIHTTEAGQIVFVDTPGIHKPHHLLGEQLVEHAKRAIGEVDLVWVLVDGTVAPGKGDQFVANLVKESGHPAYLVINKLDMVKGEERNRFLTTYTALNDWAGVYAISARHGDGVPELLAATTAALPEGPHYYPDDELTDQSLRQIAGELVREQIFRQTGEEVPHSAAVLIEDFKEREGQDMTYIMARIIVERDSQKAIVIGKGGAKLKAIGAEARESIAKLMGTRVFPYLVVDVIPNCWDEKNSLREFGNLVE